MGRRSGRQPDASLSSVFPGRALRHWKFFRVRIDSPTRLPQKVHFEDSCRRLPRLAVSDKLCFNGVANLCFNEQCAAICAPDRVRLDDRSYA